ncbi:hypothetical protein ACFL6Y_11330 [Elusimicrobiota bacterium]
MKNILIAVTSLVVITFPLLAFADRTSKLSNEPRPYFGETAGASDLKTASPVHIGDMDLRPTAVAMDSSKRQDEACKAPAKTAALSSSSKPDSNSRREAAFRLTTGLLLGGLAVCLAGAFCSSPFVGVLAMGALGALIVRFFA